MIIFDIIMCVVPESIRFCLLIFNNLQCAEDLLFWGSFVVVRLRDFSGVGRCIKGGDGSGVTQFRVGLTPDLAKRFLSFQHLNVKCLLVIW